MIHLEIVNGSEHVTFKYEKRWEKYFKSQWSPIDESAILDALPWYLKRYTRFTLWLEDLIITSPTHGKVIAFDSYTGTVQRADWTVEQACAIIQLAIVGHGPADLYQIAEAAIVGWANECRPIP